MPEAFKLYFNAEIVSQMALHISAAVEHCRVNNPHMSFDKQGFIKTATTGLDLLELKARSNLIKDALLGHMPSDFLVASSIIKAALAPPSKVENTVFDTHNTGLSGWMMMPVTDYISEAALRHDALYVDEALATLHACTQRFSAEFSVREFLRDHPQRTLSLFKTWAQDENLHVRRLVSEGCRPYLPWGVRLHIFAKHPQMIIPLLEMLKDDPSLYVRRSVANNLNDIAKDHPDLVADIANAWWDDNNKHRTALIKHACRTLVKNGHPKVLSLFGFQPPCNIEVLLSLKVKRVRMGEQQTLCVDVTNNHEHTQALLIDYVMLHQKANGTLSPKVFKWTCVNICAKQTLHLNKTHSFKAVTTRKYYQGAHAVSILINGQRFAQEAFELYDPQA